MPNTTTQTVEDRARAELLRAIREQTAAARTALLRDGAAALRDLAEAYAVITVEPLPLLHEPVAGHPSHDDD
ncbi:hypothetical protein [Streptomyces spiralis]